MPEQPAIFARPPPANIFLYSAGHWSYGFTDSDAAFALKWTSRATSRPLSIPSAANLLCHQSIHHPRRPPRWPARSSLARHPRSSSENLAQLESLVQVCRLNEPAIWCNLVRHRTDETGTAGIAELAIFHPVDTIAKRLMSNQGRITSSTQLNTVIFKNASSAALPQRLVSLFPGLGYAASYKVLQRVYKYGGQPFVRDYLTKHHGSQFDATFGKGNGKTIMHATAGSLVGIGEIVLLPLDVLKIKRQTNPEAFRGRGVVRIVADEGFGLYRGWGWTAARNAPGSFALFGGSAAAKEYLYKLSDYNTATWTQNFVASIAGASASLLVSAPLDVIKTRIQNRNFEAKEGGMTIVRNMVRNEGFTAFFKGLTPKLLMTGPKLVFSFWLAQTLIPAFGKVM